MEAGGLTHEKPPRPSPAGRTAPGGRTGVSDDPTQTPRAIRGRAPDVFRPGGWVPMRGHRDAEEVDFVIVGTGTGGGTLACKLAEYRFPVVATDAGPYFQPLEDFAPDEAEQSKLYWTDDPHQRRREPGPARLQQQRQGGGRQHRALRHRLAALPSRMVQGLHRTGLRLRLAARLAGDAGNYYTEVEQALKISGPVTYPWGPHRPRCPYRAHEMNAAALALAQGCEAIAAGAEIRDLAMVGRVEVGADGLATGVHHHREGQWRLQRARDVIVAGYAIEMPRLLLNSASSTPTAGAGTSATYGSATARCSRPWAASTRRSPSRPSPAAPATASGRWPGAASCSLRGFTHP